MTARNGNFATFPLPHQYADADTAIRAEFVKLKDAIYYALQHSGSVKADLCKLLPVLFDLRMKIIAEKPVSSFQEFIDKNELMYAKMMRLKDATGLEHLLSAIRFSMRTYDRVMRALAENHPPTPSNKLNKAKKGDLPSYDVFLVTLAHLPQGETLIEWVHSSLFIELGLIATDILVQSQKPMPQKESLEELASFANEAAQNFGSSARQLGLWPKKGNGNPIEWTETISPEDLKEEHALAEAGFSDFMEHLQ